MISRQTRMYQANYRRDHREELLAYHAEYRQSHRDEARSRANKYTAELRARVPKVTLEILKKAREDSRYEERHGILDYVVCRICGTRLKQLADRHLRYLDGSNAKDYSLRFPGAPMQCARSRQKLSREGRRRTSNLRNRARRNMKSVFAHPGEKPVRTWSHVELFAQGKSVAEVSKILKRSKSIVYRAALIVGMSPIPCRYDLGAEVTYDYLRRLYGASGLDARSFAHVFGVSLQLAYSIAAPSARSRRLNPSRADQIFGVRDSFIRELAGQKRSWEWGRNNLSGVLRSLFPHLRKTYRQLVNAFARSAEFLEAETDADIHRWQDWLCDQARLEIAGSIPGKLFTRFLPLANEVCPFVKENLERFRSGYRVSRLAIEALAWRFGTSSIIVGYCGKSEKYDPRAVPPHAMQRLILGTTLGRLASKVRAKRGGRPRKDELAARALALRAKGLTFAETATKIAREYWQLLKDEDREAWERDPAKGGRSLEQLLRHRRKKGPSSL